MSHPLTPAVLAYDLKQALDPQIAPDGRRILYTLSSPRREIAQPSLQLWLCGVDGDEVRQITHEGERNSGGRWSPDGRQIAFVSDRRGGSGLLVLPLDGGEAREITHHAQPIGEIAWSPDGTCLAYMTAFDPDNPDEIARPPEAAPPVRVVRRLDYKSDGRGIVADARQQVFVVEVATGARRRLTDGPAEHTTPQWSADGRWLACQCRLPSTAPWSHLAVHDMQATAAGAERLVGEDREMIIGPWAWSPSGQRIALTADTELSGQLDLFVYDLATDDLRRLTDDLPVQPDSGIAGRFPPSLPVWLDEQRLLIHATHAGDSGLYTVALDDGALTPVATWTATNSGLSVDRERRYAVHQHASPTAVGEIGVCDLRTGATWPATTINQALLRDAPPARSERLTVRQGAFEIDAWLLFPPDFDTERRYPVVLDVHGGPQSHHGSGFSTFQQCLATHGFLVVYANPRGSDSYGRHFTRQVLGDWGGEDFRDLMAVVDAVVARPYADPDRVGIYGGSYGGYMTAWAIGQTDRFTAALAVACVFDLESFYGTSDIGAYFGELHAGGPPHERREWYAAHSPATFAHRVRTPTLIVHGEADDRCPIGQSEQLYVALARAGCEVEFIRYPGGTHHGPRYGPPAHLEDFLTRALAWFQRHLGEPC